MWLTSSYPRTEDYVHRTAGLGRAGWTVKPFRHWFCVDEKKLPADTYRKKRLQRCNIEKIIIHVMKPMREWLKLIKRQQFVANSPPQQPGGRNKSSRKANRGRMPAQAPRGREVSNVPAAQLKFQLVIDSAGVTTVTPAKQQPADLPTSSSPTVRFQNWTGLVATVKYLQPEMNVPGFAL
jgi:hypothetical protein